MIFIAYMKTWLNFVRLQIILMVYGLYDFQMVYDLYCFYENMVKLPLLFCSRHDSKFNHVLNKKSSVNFGKFSC